MQARFKYYVKQSADIAWTLLNDEPEGWQELQEEIIRDYTIHGLLVDTKVTLTFTGDGYIYVNNIFNCQSFCSEIQLMIEESCSEGEPYLRIFEGIIKMGDIKFEMNKCTCEAPVIDNSYYARIKNNSDIEAFVNVGKSKSGVDITPASMNIVEMFDPTNGNYEGVNRKAYRVYELLKFLVAFMSDDEVDFASDYFNTGDMAGLFITNGAHLKDNTSANYQNPEIGAMSFKTLVDELYKVCNIGFTIETGTKPTLRIENSDYFYGITVTDVLANANGVVKKIKTDQLYAYVNFGSGKTIADVPALSFPDNIDFLGWKDEKFHLTGQCNIDTVLDIKGSFIRTSNVIEDVLLGISSNPNETYDEDFIFVSAEVGGTDYRAIQYDIFSSGSVPVYYNGNITNDKIALRFFGAIPSSIISWLGSQDNHFRAYREPFLSGNIGVFDILNFPGSNEPVQFNDDFTAPNHDVNNRYGNGTVQGNQVSRTNSRFTATLNGMYSFRITFEEVDCYVANSCFDVFLRRYDSFGFLIQYWDIHRCYPAVLPYLNEVFDFNGKYMNFGDYMQVDITYGGGVIPNDYDAGIIFETTLIPGGGIFQEYNNEDFKAIQYTFDYPISNSRWRDIRNNSRNKLAFNIDGLNDIEPWIEKISYSKKDSMANITLIGQQQIKNCN